MRISDWSSDGCSSDLVRHLVAADDEGVIIPHLFRPIDGKPARQGQSLERLAKFPGLARIGRKIAARRPLRQGGAERAAKLGPGDARRVMVQQFGLDAHAAQSLDQAARDRKSVVEGKSVSVRVDLGGRSIIKKKNNTP